MLIGRTTELNTLDRMIESASAGRGATCVVSGVPGIGKTRLADEASARALARGLTVRWGRASETGGAPPYWPWIEILSGLVPTAEAPARVRALLGEIDAAPIGETTRGDPARERFELFEAVVRHLRACAKRAPLLLVFDDLHAADLPSIELLAFVTRSLRGTAIGVLVTYRDVEARLPPQADALARLTREGEVLALRTFSIEEAAEVVRHEIGRFDGPLAERLFALSEGNPLFLGELLDVLRREGVDALGDRPVTASARLLAQSRMAGASDEARRVLDVAATIGREVSASLLSDATRLPHGVVVRVLDESAARGITSRRADERWVFSHVLLREALYGALSDADRARHHRAIADALERSVDRGAPGLLTTLAHHALAALPEGDAHRVLGIARAAADRARSQLAYEDAIALLTRALAACDAFGLPASERAELSIALGWAATEAGQLERGRQLFREATALARTMGDARMLARAALGQGGEYVLAEIRTELVDVLREADAALGTSAHIEDVRLRARVLARLAAALTPSPTPAEPLGLARRALALAEGDTHPRTRLDVDVGAGAALVDFAPPSEVLVVNERLLGNARALGDRVLELRSLTRLACGHLERGDVAKADVVIAAREALAVMVGQSRWRWQSALLRSMRAMPEGRYDACEAAIEEARALIADVPDPNAARCIAMHRFMMLAFAGRTDALRVQSAEALRTLHTLPDHVALETWVLGIVAACAMDRAGARNALSTLGSHSVMSARTSRAMLGDIALACDDHAQMDRIAASFASDEDANVCWGPFALACGPPVGVVLARIAFARGDARLGAAHAARALALTQRMGATASEAWARLAWGEIAHERAQLEAALELAEANDLVEVVRRAETALGNAPRAPSPPTASVLSFALRRDGDHWLVERGAQRHRLKDVRGLAMLEKLLAEPGKEQHALALAGDGESGPIDRGDAGPVIDARAIAAYKSRIAELREAITDAEDRSDDAGAARARHELEALTDQIAAAVGLGGRARRVGSPAERARITVQRRIREAIRKIAELDPELGRHLDWTVRTGTYSAYEPEGRKIS